MICKNLDYKTSLHKSHFFSECPRGSGDVTATYIASRPAGSPWQSFSLWLWRIKVGLGPEWHWCFVEGAKRFLPFMCPCSQLMECLRVEPCSLPRWIVSGSVPMGTHHIVRKVSIQYAHFIPHLNNPCCTVNDLMLLFIILIVLYMLVHFILFFHLLKVIFLNE